jgi:hypothetical protein
MGDTKEKSAPRRAWRQLLKEDLANNILPYNYPALRAFAKGIDVPQLLLIIST